MTLYREDFVEGLQGVVAFTTESRPDKDGGCAGYRGVDIEDLVNRQVSLVTCGHAGRRQFGTACRAERSPCHPQRDVRVDVQPGWPCLPHLWAYPPILDIDDLTPASSWRGRR